MTEQSRRGYSTQGNGPFGGKWVRLFDAGQKSDPSFLPLGTGDVPRRPSAGERDLPGSV